MPLDEEKYFAKLTIPYDGFDIGDIVMVVMTFENKSLVEGVQEEHKYRTWIPSAFLKRM